MTLEELRADNAERVKALAKQGAMIPDAIVIITKIEAAIEALEPEVQERARQNFELKMAEFLDKAEEQLPRAKILAGGPPAGGIVLPGQP